MQKLADNISQNSLSNSDSEDNDKNFLQKKRKKNSKKINITNNENQKIKQEKRSKRNHKNYIDISSKRERFAIKLNKSEKLKFLKSFNYQSNYIITSNILHIKKSSFTTTVNNPLFNTIDSIEEFQLPKTYHCTCRNICSP